MATSWKRAVYSRPAKAIAFVLALMCFGLTSVFAINMAVKCDTIEPLYEKDYLKSNALAAQLMDKYYILDNLLELKSEEHILADRINNVTQPRLSQFRELQQSLAATEGLLYYATDGEVTFTNLDGTQPPAEKAYFMAGETTGIQTSLAQTEMSDSVHINGDIWVAYSDEYISEMQANWVGFNYFLYTRVLLLSIFSIAGLFLLLYLLLAAGRRSEDHLVHYSAVSRIYNDINIMLQVFVIILYCGAVLYILETNLKSFFNSFESDFNFAYICTFFLSAAIYGVLLALILAVAENAKGRRLIKHSLWYVALSRLVHGIKHFVFCGRLTKQAVFVILGAEAVVALLTLLSIVAPPAVLLLLIGTGFMLFAVVVVCKKLDIINRGIEQMKEGELGAVIELEGEGYLAKVAQNLNQIAEGAKLAAEKRLKAERMKTELITNVSHDLKTPLTSIMNYVDLLSKEQLKPDEANDYVRVLKQKSLKLKNLTQDLFEMATVQSGNAQLKLERIDLSELVYQALAEYDDKIRQSHLEFRVNIQESVYILADGKRMSRVAENIIGNILKYSLPHTRVYIDVQSENGMAVAQFKNIANYEMNFNEEDILERFVRADEARTTEGNGLGLAIAQSYTAICNGKFHVVVDGDLFKAIITFPVFN